MFPHSAAELIKAKIKKENLMLLSVEDREYVSELERMLAWQENYNFVEWDEFKNWWYCERCNGYGDGQCICYAR